MQESPLYFPYADGQWRLHIGLAPLEPSRWIEIDERFEEYLTLKCRLLTERRGEVLVAMPGSETEQQEVLELLLDHLPEYFPEHYRLKDSRLENRMSGEIWNPADHGFAPLELAARLVQEDLCLMRPTQEGYILSAACVCFPSRWLLTEKVGLLLTGIHAPVPGYAEQLAGPVDRFFERLRVETPMWRINWTIVDSPELFLLPGGAKRDSQITAQDAAERLWIRIERQTLRRLAESRTVLFTIRTYVHPLHVLEQQPAMARALATAVRQIPEPMQLYKSLLPVREALLGYLDRLAR
ncbi:heme-dependent oxidative N-demethylase family protein [Gloeobacter violaceus]|uniref:Gll2346 protein n=1 Tax=Gloeobacter violaceus (strain ATCC 29082 / PCC 7421) TaxID=251221 RepID=Q7NI38_GLOVI|nr:DUF3445 domain-containing protein [Gloeobacter violaceus]BAC90287.1 gll2346 [Gloeobacter violaceus PCC 7421]